MGADEWRLQAAIRAITILCVCVFVFCGGRRWTNMSSWVSGCRANIDQPHSWQHAAGQIMHGGNGHRTQRVNDTPYHLGELAPVCQPDPPTARHERRRGWMPPSQAHCSWQEWFIFGSALFERLLISIFWRFSFSPIHMEITAVLDLRSHSWIIPYSCVTFMWMGWHVRQSPPPFSFMTRVSGSSSNYEYLLIFTGPFYVPSSKCCTTVHLCRKAGFLSPFNKTNWTRLKPTASWLTLLAFILWLFPASMKAQKSHAQQNQELCNLIMNCTIKYVLLSWFTNDLLFII